MEAFILWWSLFKYATSIALPVRMWWIRLVPTFWIKSPCCYCSLGFGNCDRSVFDQLVRIRRQLVEDVTQDDHYESFRTDWLQCCWFCSNQFSCFGHGGLFDFVNLWLMMIFRFSRRVFHSTRSWWQLILKKVN